MLRYLFREYVHKILLSSRFVMVFITIFVALISLFWNMTGAMKELGCRAGALELLPTFLCVDSGSLIYFGIFVFLVASLPKWEGSLNQVSRLGKGKWLLAQYVYVFFTAVIYYLIWTAGFIMALLPRITWSNDWSSLVKRAIDPETAALFSMDMKMNVGLAFSEKLVSVGSPARVWLLTFLLHMLAGVFVGILMVTLNICFRRGIGTVAAYLIVGVKTIFNWLPALFNNQLIHFEGYRQFKNLLIRMEFYVSPLYQCDLLVMAIHDTRPILQRVAIGAVYFLILTALVMLFGFRMVRKIDLCQE
ncbi:MAG: hypothetical protein LUH14_04395 [Clostridiaceae bacterium]|nr:hypothetical protein [Clostridiaceae bacterium]